MSIEAHNEYLTAMGIGSGNVETVTEWGVEMRATIMGKTATKVFVWRTREEAENDADYRNTLSFVEWARIVCREVTTTPWEEV